MDLYLLVPCSSPTSRTIEANGRLWSLRNFGFDRSGDWTGPGYACISYTWGTGREPSPFDSSFLVSDRTVPALQSFTRHRPDCSGIWVDAFCVPLTEPERAQTLESMGYIYSQADEVVIVLSSAALPALTSVLNSNRLDVADLAVLECEEWVERAWTYQEAVNSKTMFVTCEGEGSPVVQVYQLFSCLGYAMTHLNGSIVDSLRVYPRLNAFEDIMADYYTANYEERAALNIMSNMDRRVQGRAEDHFYAMIGAISAERASAMVGVQPCEAFMRVCEKKGDFSFIYSAAGREKNPPRRWRPVAGDLPSILPWHGWGARQPGRLSDDGLWLDGMLVAQPAVLQEEAKRVIEQKLSSFGDVPSNPQHSREEAVYAVLQVMGFTGSPQCVSTTQGYLFPFEPVTSSQDMSVMVSTALRWSIGAPGLLSYEDEEGKRAVYTSGVYVGIIEEAEATSVLVS